MKSLKILSSLLLSSLFIAPPVMAKTERPPQYILISFDGSYTAGMWEATREHALASGAEVAHFISGVDFLKGSSNRTIPGALHKLYTPPRFNGRTRSQIGFGGFHEEVAVRINEMQASMNAGMEIGSHANGHFDGTSWDTSEWSYEFDLFDKFVFNVFSLNGISEREAGVRVGDWTNSLYSHLKSFRAPQLGRGNGLWNTMNNHNMVYDASDVAQSPSDWPSKVENGKEYDFWFMRMAAIPVPGRKPVLSMDYNFYVAQSNAQAVSNEATLQDFGRQMYAAYANWFNTNYHGNRAPINIGHHFSTWNKGIYWKTLKRFMTNVCTLPEVRCVTGLELAHVLNNTSSKTLANYRDGNFDRSGTPRVELPTLVNISQKVSKDDLYPWVKNGVATLPSAKGLNFKWKSGDKALNSKDLKLADLAKHGVSRIDLVTSDSNGLEKVLEYYIQWTPSTDDAQLIRWYEPEEVSCDAKAHEEKVDKFYLNDGIRI